MTTRPAQKHAAGSGDSKAHAKGQCGPGRPRGYDEQEVLSAALQVFWRQGYEATSLDDLTGAMGLSRSSFYAAFGSKQGVLIAALKSYSATALSALRELADGPREGAVRAMLQALSNPQGGPKGCLLVNCITELAPHEQEVAEIGRRHLQGVEDLFASALNPEAPESVQDKARALSALAIGTLTLRKSGLPPDQISKALEAAEGILTS
ncbi:TetR/AcrR family transcriptional regulator [Roseibium litorale]|uniref:TetR/AcrR family transcriptional regulator n=1 Tax=Roseibium litorale TaxID=2803841 RepID=A0ABR9CRJ7_9HYPH|nr:TetR/AcrR family transcriptional regulator [Roseibium litorale]MBD8893244.1 TetR/AcrR family transcriptional regulator [Roseibium litorale]